MDGFVVDLDKQRLDGAPYYKDRNFAWGCDYGRHVDEYYGVSAHWT